MSIQAVAWALDQELPARPKLVLVAIANHANHTDGYCWLKAETIGREASCTARSVYNFIGALVRNGFIRKALRRGEDGKQRANDYWIIFDREDRPWESPASGEAPEGEYEADENASAEDRPQDVVEPSEQDSLGEKAEQSERHDSRQAAEIPAGSCGPHEATFTRKESLEPSNSNPKKDAREETPRAYRPRTYKPPPPQPLGAVVADREAKMIFVFAGTRAWDAWVKCKRKETGVTCWNLTTTAIIDGRQRTGWWFPSLFPPPSRNADIDELADEVT